MLCLYLYASTPENGLSVVLGGFVPAIRSVALVGCKVVGMVLYDLPAIRSVAWCSCKAVRLQGCGMVLYDLPAIRSVWFLGLQGSGMVLYDLPAIRSVAWCVCKVPGWFSMVYPPSDRWPGAALFN